MATLNSTTSDVLDEPTGPCGDPSPPARRAGSLSEPSLNFGVMLHHVREGLIRRIESGLADSRLDLNFSQFRVLKSLHEGHATTATEIARWMNHDAGALTRLLDRMVARGLLQRRPRTGDRRQIDLVLTDAGNELAEKMRAVAEHAVAGALDPLSADEREHLMGLLERIRERLSDTPRKAGA